jgi:hypothetical protein
VEGLGAELCVFSSATDVKESDANVAEQRKMCMREGSTFRLTKIDAYPAVVQAFATRM